MLGFPVSDAVYDVLWGFLPCLQLLLSGRVGASVDELLLLGAGRLNVLGLHLVIVDDVDAGGGQGLFPLVPGRN